MKEEILQQASDMFLTLGFKSVTMDDIAQRMGISKKTIYLHFATKPELVEACTEYLFEKVSHGIDCICSLNKNAIEELFAIKAFMAQQLKNEAASPLYQLQKYFPSVFKCLRKKQFEKMKSCVEGNIEKGIQLGLYRPNLNPDFISRIYFVLGTGIKDIEVFPPEQFENKALTDQFLEYHLRAIVTPAGLDLLERLILNHPN
jgi:AcrR family transcriptional regulator